MQRFIFFFLFISSCLTAQQLRVATTASEITYEASHAIHDWSGTSNEVQGVLVLKDAVPDRLALTVSVASFDSKNEGRDAHALEVLEALLFPKASFYSEDMILEGDVLFINGTLKFHGMSIPLSTTTKWVQNKDAWLLEGAFDIQPSAFGITLPSFMLVKIRDLIHIRFQLELRTFAS